MHSTHHQTLWSTSGTRSAEPKHAQGPSFGVAGTKTAEYCAQHAPDGMVNVCSRKCRTESCGKEPSFGVAGTKAAEYCAQHAPDGMVNVCSKECKTEVASRSHGSELRVPKKGSTVRSTHRTGWSTSRTESAEPKLRKGPLFGVAGTTTAEYCAQHAPDGMVNVFSKKCRTESCGKIPSFGVAGQNRRSTVHNTHRTEWLTSAARSAEPKAATSNHRSEWQVQKWRSTVHSTHRTGWSTSRTESAKLKVAERGRGLEWQVQQWRNYAHSTHRTEWSRSGRNAKPKVAIRFHRSEWQVQKRRSIVHSTHRTE